MYIVLYNIMLCLSFIVLYCILHCIVWNCTVFYIVLYCTIFTLYCIELYYILGIAILETRQVLPVFQTIFRYFQTEQNIFLANKCCKFHEVK